MKRFKAEQINVEHSGGVHTMWFSTTLTSHAQNALLANSTR